MSRINAFDFVSAASGTQWSAAALFVKMVYSF